jgi:hypothetical protein
MKRKIWGVPREILKNQQEGMSTSRYYALQSVRHEARG